VATRRIQFVGRNTRKKSIKLADGRVVERDEVVDVDPREASQLLSNPGEATDEKADWIAVPIERE